MQPTVEWLQLVYRVPPKPTRMRTYVWRQLRGMGAVYLQDACCVLPRTEDAELGLAVVAAKVREFGGEATLSVLTPAEPGWDERMVSLLNRARDEEYEELLNTIERLEDEVARETRKRKFTFAALEEVEDEWTRIDRWLLRVRARDPFGAPGRVPAERELAKAKRALETFTDKVHQEQGAHQAGRAADESRRI